MNKLSPRMEIVLKALFESEGVLYPMGGGSWGVTPETALRLPGQSPGSLDTNCGTNTVYALEDRGFVGRTFENKKHWLDPRRLTPLGRLTANQLFN